MSNLLVSLAMWLFCLVKLSNSACPYANMAKQFNFSGDWLIDFTLRPPSNPHPEDGIFEPIKLDPDDIPNDKYEYLPPNIMFHVCHSKGSDALYFTISLEEQFNKTLQNENDYQNIDLSKTYFIGVGGGNWSSWQLGIGGMKYILGGALFPPGNTSIDNTGFIMSMHTSSHSWWYKDLYHEGKATQLNTIYRGNEFCGVPYHHDDVIKYNKDLRIRRNRKRLQKQKRAKERARKKAKAEGKYLSKKELRAIRDAVPYEEDEFEFQTFDTIFGKSYKSNNNDIINIINNNSICIYNNQNNYNNFYNITSIFDGLGFVSYWKNETDNTDGSIFYVQISENQAISSFTYNIANYERLGVTDMDLQLNPLDENNQLNCPNTYDTNINDQDDTNEEQCTSGSDKCEL